MVKDNMSFQCKLFLIKYCRVDIYFLTYFARFIAAMPKPTIRKSLPNTPPSITPAFLLPLKKIKIIFLIQVLQ